MSTTTIAYVGSRTTPDRGTGTGISSFAVTGGRWTLLKETPAVNPGFLAVDSVRRVLHAASGDRDYITSYRMHGDGALEELGKQSTEGTNPAHTCLDPAGRFVLVANHASGSVVSLPVLTDGTLGSVAGKLEFSGKPGPHRTDQVGSKPHQVMFSPAGDYFLVPDKGLDTVFSCRLEPGTGRVELLGSTRLREFSGPRHVVFHPRRLMAYSINELNSTVTAIKYAKPSSGLPVQVVPTLACSDVRDSRAAELAISPDGRFLYASNRSGAGDKTPGGPDEDTGAVFAIGEDGILSPVTWIGSGGIRPRFITLEAGGRTLYSVNEKSGSIWSFPADARSGTLGPGAAVAQTGSPVCLVFARF